MDEQQPEPVALKQTTPIHHTDPPPIDPNDFDPHAYLEMAKDFDMTESEKVELLTILFDIMRRFVELGWGLDSVSMLLGDQPHKPENNQKNE